jgi:hypothetical protein
MSPEGDIIKEFQQARPLSYPIIRAIARCEFILRLSPIRSAARNHVLLAFVFHLLR